MKKIWSKKRFQKTGHSSRTFGRFTHDSETTEDEAAEPQIPMESKDSLGVLQEPAAQRVPTGDGDRMTDITPDTSGRRGSLTDSWMASQNTVVEKEVFALGSRAPGPQDLSKPARQANGREPAGTHIRHLGVEPLIRASRANLSRPVWGSEESVSLASDYYGSTFSLYRGRTFSIAL